MTIYITRYNNYYNRTVKMESNLQDYIKDVVYSADQINFNPNDGVNTTITMGTGDYTGEGDYFIVTTPQNEIVSRWFIIDAVRTRLGQYTLTLRRDLIVDFYNKIVTAPCFIEKAIVPDSSPLIFNSEQMAFNQIKKGELLIRDRSRCPWIVGYYAKNTPTEQLSGTIAAGPNNLYDIQIDTTFEDWKYNVTEKTFRTSQKLLNIGIRGNLTSSIGGPTFIVAYLFNGDGSFANSVIGNETETLKFKRLAINALKKELAAASYNLLQAITTGYLEGATDSESDYFLNLNGKKIRDINGEIYSILIQPQSIEQRNIDIKAGSAFNILENVVIDAKNNYAESIDGTPDQTSFYITVEDQPYTMTAVRQITSETKWDLTAPKIPTEDAPYNIFAIPVGDIKLTSSSGDLGTSSAEYAMRVAESMIRTMGSNLYDIQLLPYCPLYLENNKEIDVKSSEEYAIVTGPSPNDEFLTFILNVPQARFSKYINLTNPVLTANKKISNECDVYKLCSPNWAAEFQFSPVKNDGVYGFDLDCEYKPYMPYIHLAPRFGGLYGRDFNDARGLICGGDFSLSQIQDNWQQYQINNKNYQNTFDRQIQNMEVQHNVQRIGDVLGAVTGTVSGAMSGAMSGTMASPGVGTIAGAVVGGGASLVGGIADYQIKEKLRNEAIDYSKDLFGYQLDNIKALPYTLTKVTAYNNNNKIFPVLEYYTCTDIEKKALAKKIIYNGMSVGVIGTIQEYLNYSWSYFDINEGYLYDKGFIKGQIIRIDDLGEDYHIANSIAGEISKGVYTK